MIIETSQQCAVVCKGQNIVAVRLKKRQDIFKLGLYPLLRVQLPRRHLKTVLHKD